MKETEQKPYTKEQQKKALDRYFNKERPKLVFKSWFPAYNND